MYDQLLSAVEAVIDDADGCETFLSNAIAACHGDQNDDSDNKESLHQENEFRWLSMILPVTMKLSSSLSPSPCSAALKEVVTRCSLLDDAFRNEDDYLTAAEAASPASVGLSIA